MGDMRQIELEDEQGAACEAEMDLSCDILDAGSESDYGSHGGYSEADEAILQAGPVDWDAEDYRDEVVF